ncbi:MAG: MHS family MFS transporter [Proteobacteria bacterium]|nr:MHS family MFS transporter [Pseudomonadota bacterium]
MAGTGIEFFDFYIYATAAVLVFPTLFFPAGDPASATLQSLATFALAFFARPLGSALFGHFGDRIGRKATLVTALLTMGLSTVCIGLLPTYASAGVLAPLGLAICRLGQGIGLGGEWGGAVLLATENAPPGRHAWYGCFPQLGAPLGFWCSTGVFLLLTQTLSNAQLLQWGWRIPFLASAVLVALGLYVRLQLVETPAFRESLAREQRERVPLLTVVRHHTRSLVLGTLAATTTFAVFYLMTVFALSWATSALGFARPEFLKLQMIGVVFFALLIPASALLADRIGARATLIASKVAVMAFGFSFAPWFATPAVPQVLLFLCVGLALMGMTYGPLGSYLAAAFPTRVRYTGISLAFNLAGILGASLAPYIATTLATRHGIAYAGGYLTAVAAISLAALLALPAGGDSEAGPA